MKSHIWVRAEQRPLEKRVGITPEGVSSLVDAGFQVTVEGSAARIIPTEKYAATGCDIKPANSWIDAPDDAIIFGLKELNEDGPDLRHRHIMFGHAYKGQADGPHLLARFKRAGGALFDLEYLTDASAKRVAAFGYWAGFAGAAMGVKTWIAQQKNAKLGSVTDFENRDALVDQIRNDIAPHAAETPTAIVIGANGRVGSGAVDFCEMLNIKTTKWDIAETASGGPFPEILKHTIFINCILANENVPIFLPKEAIDQERKLQVVADIACDPSSSFNPVPIYDRSTSFVDPVIRVAEPPNVLDVMAIDNLPSMLPLESSQDFAKQLLPYLLQLDDDQGGVWQRAEEIFRHHI